MMVRRACLGNDRKCRLARAGTDRRPPPDQEGAAARATRRRCSHRRNPAQLDTTPERVTKVLRLGPPEHLRSPRLSGRKGPTAATTRAAAHPSSSGRTYSPSGRPHCWTKGWGHGGFSPRHVRIGRLGCGRAQPLGRQSRRAADAPAGHRLAHRPATRVSRPLDAEGRGARAGDGDRGGEGARALLPRVRQPDRGGALRRSASTPAATGRSSASSSSPST